MNSKNVTTNMKKLQLFSVTDIYNSKLLCIAHKMKYNNDQLPYFLQNMYKNKEKFNLRNKIDFIILYFKTTIAQNSLNYKIAAVWNKRPSDIKKDIPFGNILVSC